MEIFVADGAGFCFGVRRAVDCVYNEAKKGKVCTYGEIIHNKTVVGQFADMGVRVVGSLDDIAGETVILRSHGVPPAVYEELSQKNIRFIDCTCPYVKKIHRLVQNDYENGYSIILIGDRNHPEIIGINGWADNSAIIIGGKGEIDAYTFDAGKKYSVFVQTTFNPTDFEDITTDGLKNLKNLKITNTICSATVKNQAETLALARKVDKMLVIGDKNSANTKKLYEISVQNLKSTYFIQTINEIQLKNFSDNDKIGITAGASTPPAIIKEAYKFMSEIEIGNNQLQSFEEMLDETMVMLHTGDIVTGTVIQVSNGEVLVNLGFKSDGIIIKGQYSDDPDVDVSSLVSPGDQIEVFVVRVNDGDGNVLLSRKRVSEKKGYAELEEAAENGAILKGKIVEVVKGGVMASINGVRVFVPSSQVSNRFVEDLSTLLGKEFNFNIIQFDKAKKRIVAGRKELAAAEAAASKEKAFETLEVGQKIAGTVSRIADFGAFVDLGGVDGLIHISQLSWARVKRVSDVLKEGQAVTVTVLEIDKEKGKISLSLRDVDSDPWINAEVKYAIGETVEGKVVRMVPFGAFIELEEGIDGLVHVSQISGKRINKPDDVLKIGEIITAKVTEFDIEKKKISLSIKAVNAIMSDFEPEVESEAEAEVAHEPIVEPEPVVETETVVEPEPIGEAEAVVEPESVVEATTVAESEEAAEEAEAPEATADEMVEDSPPEVAAKDKTEVTEE